MEKSEGPYLFDKRSGKKYLDLFSFFASWPISHNHEKLKADKKFLNQIAQVALHNPANSDIYTIEMAQFVATFERVAMPAEFKVIYQILAKLINSISFLFKEGVKQLKMH